MVRCRGEILEFSGCIATGDTPDEALSSLEEVARDWLTVALEQGQFIPEPVENTEFSGRLVLRLPKSLHKKATRIAERDGVSLNQLIVMSLAEQVGERSHITNRLNFSFTNNNIFQNTVIGNNVLSFTAQGKSGALSYLAIQTGGYSFYELPVSDLAMLPAPPPNFLSRLDKAPTDG
jgi:predicted HicB family RNase H-like nuclease